ncbi:MAG: ORF6N domain-containing protein [Candidatus Saganbacteria bacterium]|nr:ORF6N domain-containing protein [Candidatus Saganbacteria bacterium]
MPVERIESKIYLIRGQKVMLDRDLASFYGVKTKALNQAVQRNLARFPEDFMFQLTWQEAFSLRSQFVTLNNQHDSPRKPKETSKRGKHIKYLPYVFTELGGAMLSSVLRSQRAIEINIMIVRAFVRLRGFLSTHKKIAEKLKKLEKKGQKHGAEIQTIFNVLRRLMSPSEKPVRHIGFRPD